MRTLYDIMDMCKDELRSIAKKDEISEQDLDNVYKMVDIVKDITTVEAMKRAEESGYSRDYSNTYSMDDYSQRYAYGRRGRDGDSDGRYSEDSSYRRGRDTMGRYTSRDGYSGREGGYSGHSKEQMIEHLEEMMRNAKSEQERESYRRALEQIEK